MSKEIDEQRSISRLEKLNYQTLESHVPLLSSEKKYFESLKKFQDNFENKRELLLNSCPKLNENLKPSGEQRRENIHVCDDLLNDLTQFQQFQKMLKKIY
ncbi:hypothetical protein DERP_002651 [Dermatophagoides pteronyssinus]|uniref:Uncharacterized protein n=1 Tax=Dermatophagoides pteronyssinus TaxID=6956 RepID=A0ABQ8JWB5_DERPT|nr:hypothetical protein DERP_002651 [Dermatophagoides pteronyssinus]